MSRTFHKMRTESGMQKCQDLIGHDARELDLTIESHGAHSIEAAGKHLILGSMHYLMGDFASAEPHIWSHGLSVNRSMARIRLSCSLGSFSYPSTALDGGNR